MSHKIKIYSDQIYLNHDEKFEIFFVPFWGNCLDKKNDPDFGRFSEYDKIGKD